MQAATADGCTLTSLNIFSGRTSKCSSSRSEAYVYTCIQGGEKRNQFLSASTWPEPGMERIRRKKCEMHESKNIRKKHVTRRQSSTGSNESSSTSARDDWQERRRRDRVLL